MANIDLKMIFASKKSNKLQKTRFCKEKSVENVVTLEGLPSSLDYNVDEMHNIALVHLHY